MGQSEVLELLQTQDVPLSTREISEMLKDDYCKVSKDINKMLQYNEIDSIEIDKEEALKKYNSKRRLRLYYVKKS